jgi:hypothetical protein
MSTPAKTMSLAAHFRNASVRENGSFKGSPRREDLVRLAKETFPDDKEIQALEEK